MIGLRICLWTFYNKQLFSHVPHKLDDCPNVVTIPSNVSLSILRPVPHTLIIIANVWIGKYKRVYTIITTQLFSPVLYILLLQLVVCDSSSKLILPQQRQLKRHQSNQHINQPRYWPKRFFLYIRAKVPLLTMTF